MNERLALEIRGLSKQFGETRALKDVDLTLRAGEIHGLLGHNGSGKSTLIKVLAGYQDADDGSVYLDGHDVPLPVQPSILRTGGMRFVHQSLGLVEKLTVAENLWLEQIALGSRDRLSFGTLCRDARGVFEEFGLDLDPREAVSSLTAVKKANLAIVRAMIPLSAKASIPTLVVLDEPTAFLPPEDKQHLYALVRRVADQGSAVLLVSHFLEEVLGLCGRVSVLRDGEVVMSGAPTAQIEIGDLMRAVVGTDGDEAGLERAASGEGIQVSVRGLEAATVNQIDIDLRRGEVVGLTGPIGSGSDEIPMALFGAAQASGTIEINGRKLDLSRATPADAMSAGVALVPADRSKQGIFGALSVVDNLSVTELPAYRMLGVLQRRRMRNDAAGLTRDYDIRPRRPELPISALSGGNAQKVLIAKWLRSGPRLLLLQEPTQGVDVGARRQIEQMILTSAAGGASVLVSSGDPDQLAALCHRVLVLAEGRVVQTLEGPELTKHNIAQACLSPLRTDAKRTVVA